MSLNEKGIKINLAILIVGLVSGIGLIALIGLVSGLVFRPNNCITSTTLPSMTTTTRIGTTTNKSKQKYNFCKL